ncbi:MAG: tRNA ((37)-N6)-threonylcarbamoyltransferase complex transferase subunit TsaD [Bacteroidota bacterium]|jgi:N6-L-threonylcarbamoyladenine synthase
MHPSSVNILAIESSCDDTAAAVLCDGKIRANIVAGQEVHRQYGGVVPELAGRAHQSNILPVVQQALNTAGIHASSLDAIAFTKGPGLMGSLLVGAGFAKGLSVALGKPLIGVDHLHAHVSAVFIEHQHIPKPMLCLLVSGGHTQLVWIGKDEAPKIIGSTLDDAAGEALDKAAKLLGLPYPGGPVIDRLAKQGRSDAFTFSTARVQEHHFSFSGIKTSLLYFLNGKDPAFVQEHLKDICASYQEHVMQYLMHVTGKSIAQLKPASIALSGGVSANSRLRTLFGELAAKFDIPAFIPSFEYCTDNAAMIAMAAYQSFLEGRFSPLDELTYARQPSGEN